MSKLATYRKDNRLSQIELGDAARVPRSRIQIAERGIPVFSRPQAVRIAKVLQLATDPLNAELEALVMEDETNAYE